jgi:GAG-pre-integrase domain
VDLLLLHHKRLGHPSFSLLSRLYSCLFEKAKENKLFCDVCELGKHTKNSYVSSSSMSYGVFSWCIMMYGVHVQQQLSMNFDIFVFFVDCCSRITWLYFMKKK